MNECEQLRQLRMFGVGVSVYLAEPTLLGPGAEHATPCFQSIAWRTKTSRLDQRSRVSLDVLPRIVDVGFSHVNSMVSVIGSTVAFENEMIWTWTMICLKVSC